MTRARAWLTLWGLAVAAVLGLLTGAVGLALVAD
jgi:hypothetical protein